MQRRRTNPERSELTRTTLLAAARELFLERGFAGASTTDLVARTAVTRGALYHHFADKLALFRAVVVAEAEQVAREIEASPVDGSDPLEALRAGSRAFFAAMRDSGRARLLLIEGPAVLGAEEMRRIDSDTGGRQLREGLRALVGHRATRSELEALADVLSAAFDRAALARASNRDVAAYRRAIDRLLASIATAPDP